MTEDLAKELASDYAAYLSIDSKSELSCLDDTIEDILARLDEFETLATMVKSDVDPFVYDTLSVKLKSYKPQLEELCTRVDNLDLLVNRISQDMDSLEESVERAKVEVGGATTNRISSFLRPFFFKAPFDQPSKKSTRTTPVEGPTFSADDYFPLKIETP